MPWAVGTRVNQRMAYQYRDRARHTLQSRFSVGRYQLVNKVGTGRKFCDKNTRFSIALKQLEYSRLTLFGKVEQFRHRLAVGQTGTLHPQLVKEFVCQCLHGPADMSVSQGNENILSRLIGS